MSPVLKAGIPVLLAFVDQLRDSRPILAERIAAGKLRIVGAVCSLDTGTVTWLPEPAAQ